MATKVSKSLITSVDVSQINTTGSDAGKVLTSNGSTLNWVTSSAITPSTGIVAWVNFTGTGSVGNQVINASYNVASVAKTSTGSYTVTFANDLQDANYNTHVNVLATASSTSLSQVAHGSTPSVSQVRILTMATGGTAADANRCYVTIIR